MTRRSQWGKARAQRAIVFAVARCCACSWLLACRPASATNAPVGVPPLRAGGTPAFVARQKVVATHAAQRTAFDAVLQFDGRALVLLGMTPMGTKAFAVVQRGASFEVTHFVDMPLPAQPEAILGDIHAAYFDLPQRVRSDGWHRRRRSPIREHWAAGRLEQRVWGRPRDRRAMRLRFIGGLAPGEIPQELALDHPPLELRLEIHTLELRPGPTSDPDPSSSK